MGGSSATFEDFVNSHAGGLLRTACLITWDDDEAEDLVQEALLRVSRHWRRVQTMELPLAYARRVLINLAFAGNDRRSRRRRELGTGHDGGRAEVLAGRVDEGAEAALHALSERSALLDALGMLPTQQRTVLALRYFEDLSEAQIADLLGCSTGTVKSSASRGLDRLRELMPRSTTTTSEVRDR